MDYRWDVMVAITVPKGLNGWQNRGKVIINGRKFLFPVGVSTMVPEPVAFYVEESIKREEANNRPPSMPPEDEGADCECVVSIIESASPTAADLGNFCCAWAGEVPECGEYRDS